MTRQKDALKPGFYWVRAEDYAQRVIAELSHEGNWYLSGVDCAVNARHIDVLSDRLEFSVDIAPASGLPGDFDFDTVIETAHEMHAELTAEVEDLQRRLRFLDAARSHFQKLKADRLAAREAALSG